MYSVCNWRLSSGEAPATVDEETTVKITRITVAVQLHTYVPASPTTVHRRVRLHIFQKCRQPLFVTPFYLLPLVNQATIPPIHPCLSHDSRRCIDENDEERRQQRATKTELSMHGRWVCLFVTPPMEEARPPASRILFVCGSQALVIHGDIGSGGVSGRTSTIL